ncbi:hypothetical protein VPH35_077676 [Triticum aestivum]|uniref:3-beta hydroxysteroid dehydrogenase/isomerase domain-containing protein n=1 Tax=Aegilops tauschii subsp. strangulata TaxID=200361 RepID=A0A453HW06_AEGTS
MHLSENEGIEGVRFAVTGGQGFVSAALCLELIRRGALQVCSLDDSTCVSAPLGPSSSSTSASASSKVLSRTLFSLNYCGSFLLPRVRLKCSVSAKKVICFSVQCVEATMYVLRKLFRAV